MSHGLRIWDASGKLKLDITDRFPKIFAAFYVTMNWDEIRTLNVPGFIPGDFLIDSDFAVHSLAVDSVTIRNWLSTGTKSGSVYIFKG